MLLALYQWCAQKRILKCEINWVDINVVSRSRYVCPFCWVEIQVLIQTLAEAKLFNGLFPSECQIEFYIGDISTTTGDGW